MKFASEFRDPATAKGLLAAIARQADAIGASRAKPCLLYTSRCV